MPQPSSSSGPEDPEGLSGRIDPKRVSAEADVDIDDVRERIKRRHEGERHEELGGLATDALLARAHEVTRQLTSRYAAGSNEPRTHDAKMRARDLKDREDRAKLRMIVAAITLGMMLLQLVAVNVFMFMFALNNDWDVSDSVIVGWLAGTFVEIIAVVAIIARHLFPGEHNDS